jgi:integrase
MYRFSVEHAMPRAPRQPAYRLHKARNCAVVTIGGKNRYLGPYDSPQSHQQYARLIAEWKAQLAERGQPEPARPQQALSVNEVLQAFWLHAKAYYVTEGRPTPEQVAYWSVIRTVQSLYGTSPVLQFGPLALKAVREHLIDRDLCRTEVNKRLNRIKHIFKWAVGEELIPAGIYEALRTVEALRFGRTRARESKKVKPVHDELVDVVLPLVSKQVAAMIQLQRLTGMRPGEVVVMRGADIDRSGDVWVYEPHQHKNRWRDHRRLVPLGPKAQEILRPYLDRPEEIYLFSPAEAEAERNANRRQRRRTKITPSQAKRRPRRRPKRAKRERYDRDSYRRAISYGIEKAKGLEKAAAHWHPHQLRHTHGTKVRKLFGIEAAQLALGQQCINVTELYAERNLALAARVAGEIG